MEECIFCKIVSKEIPSAIVYEDDSVMAFNDINPEAPIHVLIVPKKHIPSLQDFDPEDSIYLVGIHMAAKKIAERLKINKSGYRLINNCGTDAGQTVFHLHYHLVGGRKLGTKIL